MDTCKRSDGSPRAAFSSKAEAEAHAMIAPGYEHNVAHLCVCGAWHLAQIDWLLNRDYLTTVVTFIDAVN